MSLDEGGGTHTAIPRAPPVGLRPRSFSIESIPMANEDRLNVARKVKITAETVMVHFLEGGGRRERQRPLASQFCPLDGSNLLKDIA